MCGIIAIVRRQPTRETPRPDQILELIGRAVQRFDLSSVHSLEVAIGALGEANRLLAGVPGVTCLLDHPELAVDVESRLAPVAQMLAMAEELDPAVESESDERLNAARVSVRDVLWSIRIDRLNAATGVRTLAGGAPALAPAAITGLLSVHDALSALDRLEVRGRDSIGLHINVTGHNVDLESPSIALQIAERSTDPAFRNFSLRHIGETVGFVYKHAAEIGDLGDNTAALRRSIIGDELLATLLNNDSAEVMVLGHTRWASVGIVSEANAHPVNSDSVDRGSTPYFFGALNGDVDNYADLAAGAGLAFDPAVTTDAKVIPALIADGIDRGASVHESFRGAVASFEGSVAIAVGGSDEPGVLHLAQRGSGQALYIGVAEDTFVVASEPYGVVELTSDYVRLDGETPVDPNNPASARGQVMRLHQPLAGELAGMQRFSYDGRELEVTADDIAHAEITTSDIDRAGYAHFLLKEISEAPRSFRTTLLGKLRRLPDGYEVQLPESTLPAALCDRISSGSIKRVVTIGQGTAAVAAQACGNALRAQLPDGELRVESTLASELSGFGITADMSDVLVIAVSQSGTTTDTNRTVDVVRERGASVLAIVNRRGSDLTEKVDGVLYTSDGRDVEMSVASTKAFYSQVAAGFLLATAIADQLGRTPAAAAATQRILAGLGDLPAAMESVIANRARIGEIAGNVAPPRPYWAIVGSGSNRVAAEEIRIKLSELCYKAIACDSIEDKKHIDLSSEPLIFVCAAGLRGSTADDALKEVAIYRAHKAEPVVVASAGEERFGATNVIRVPDVEPELGFVLSAVAGHLFGYEAALAIDALALPMRRLRSSIEAEIAESPQGNGADMLHRLAPSVRQARRAFGSDLRQQRYNGQLESSTAVDLALLLRYAEQSTELGAFQLDFGKVGTPAVVIEDLARVLSRAIDELTRPIDAIKHQAKTVTVGISRSDETLLHVPLVARTIEAGASRDALTYQTLRTLAGLDAAVVEVVGHTRYRIDGDPHRDDATVAIIDRGGISVGIESRVDRDPSLRGTKHRVAIEGKVLITRGRRDQRVIALVPEVKDAQPIGITLLHLRLAEHLDLDELRPVLQSYRNRFTAIRDAVLETESDFDEAALTGIDLVDLLVVPAATLADQWPG